MAPQKKNQAKRNERERKRVHQVNDGFDVLRTRLQIRTANKKLSKADTLREAVKYIEHLQAVLNGTIPPDNYSISAPSSSSSRTTSETYFPKVEYDQYYQNNSNPQDYYQVASSVPPSHSTTGCIPYTSPSSMSSSYSPQQMYYSPPPVYHNSMQSSP